MCVLLVMATVSQVTSRVDNTDMCINIYDIRLDDTYPSCGMNWPPEIKPVTKYLDVCTFICMRLLPDNFHSETMLSGLFMHKIIRPSG